MLKRGINESILSVQCEVLWKSFKQHIWQRERGCALGEAPPAAAWRGKGSSHKIDHIDVSESGTPV
ncbi:MAG: hypothetical protein ACTID3_18550 [Halomonas sp.]|uniref:hypothetical protein n=1 Tax=Halomonas sp. TaxID=1486246 RepID=UPI003F8DB276